MAMMSFFVWSTEVLISLSGSVAELLTLPPGRSCHYRWCPGRSQPVPPAAHSSRIHDIPLGNKNVLFPCHMVFRFQNNHLSLNPLFTAFSLLRVNIFPKLIRFLQTCCPVNLRPAIGIPASTGKHHAPVMKADVINKRKLIIRYCLLKRPEKIIR